MDDLHEQLVQIVWQADPRRRLGEELPPWLSYSSSEKRESSIMYLTQAWWYFLRFRFGYTVWHRSLCIRVANVPDEERVANDGRILYNNICSVLLKNKLQALTSPVKWIRELTKKPTLQDLELDSL